MKSRFCLLLLFVGIGLLNGTSCALAESYVVGVRQINPDGPVQETVCGDKDAFCFLELDVFSDDKMVEDGKERIDIGFGINVNVVRFDFKEKGEDLSTHQGYGSYQIIIGEDMVKGKVVLYEPHPLSKTDSPEALVYREPVREIAELEITIRPEQGAGQAGDPAL